MAVEIPDVDALKKYLEEKNLTLAMDGQQREQPRRVLMPYHWKWEDIEPAGPAHGRSIPFPTIRCSQRTSLCRVRFPGCLARTADSSGACT